MTARCACWKWLISPIIMAVFIHANVAKCHEFVWIDSQKINTLALNAGMRDRSLSISRNQDGTKLYGAAYDHNEGTTAVQIYSSIGSSGQSVSGARPVFGSDGQLLCVIKNKAVSFTSGEQLPLTAHTRFGFSPDGLFFFFLQDFKAGAALFRSTQPHHSIVKLPTHFLPQNVFYFENELYVFGRTGAPGDSRMKTAGLVYVIVNESGRLKRRIDLSRFGGVMDMDPSNGLLAVVGKGEIQRRWGLYNLQNNKYIRKGSAGGQGLFLHPNLIQALEPLWE